MRIAVISYHSSPLDDPGAGDSGGMTIYVREVARALESMGVATDIFTRSGYEVAPILQLSDRVRVVSIAAGPPNPIEKGNLGRYVDDFAAGCRAFALSDGVSYDVVHSHYWYSGAAAQKLTRAWGIPHVHSSHTLARVKNRYLAPGDAPETRERLIGESRVLGGADAVVASTDTEGYELTQLYGVDPAAVKVISPGVDHALFAPGDRGDARRRLGLDADASIILFVGRIQPLKGVELLLKATTELAPVLTSPWRLLVVGGASGPGGRDELARLAEVAKHAGISDHIDWVGPVAHESLPTYYRASNVAVAPSYSESFGLAALEAQASGIPVVATDVGGLSEIVKDERTGYLIPQRDSASLAAALKEILSDPGRAAAMGRLATARSRRYDWATTGASLLELYKNKEAPETWNEATLVHFPTHERHSITEASGA